MKRLGLLSAVAAFILAAAAICLGGLNQDEGWYLYAAQLVGDGAMPYRDFFYTQGPLMPLVYAPFRALWSAGGLLTARIWTLLIGAVSLFFAIAIVRRVAPSSLKRLASLLVFLLLGCNLYHLYYLAIPKTYSLASLFVAVGFYLFAVGATSEEKSRGRIAAFVSSGVFLAFAAGTRISLGALLAVAGFALLASFRRFGLAFLWFGIGGAAGLAIVYGPFILDDAAFSGLCAAQSYHASRGGFSPIFTIGSLSRLIRWYLPLFIVAGLSIAAFVANRDGADDDEMPESISFVRANRRFIVWVLFAGFLAVFAVQMLAPYPYEDYQVPVMALLAIASVAMLLANAKLYKKFTQPLTVLTFGLAFATSFGSPLLEEWMTDGCDRFWSLKKEKPEIFQLKDAAEKIEEIDPCGKTLLTQDLYLAIETDRKVPKGLEMGPFSMLTMDEWRKLLQTTDAKVAAISGYSFSIEPPVCCERKVSEQRELRGIVKSRYKHECTFRRFGQNATTLELLSLKEVKK